ncbi:MAG: hypothetical protein NWF06_02315 [Candidatus Bathyarchaeota archaeon]|nr:hypothetical protein [Candidatus Bathyarchaeum sp.]
MSLDLYNKFRVVPKEAQKPIGGGRLKGMTDINPMWRIKALTEQFGAVGQGWYYDITNKWIVEGANGEQVAFVDINLFVKFGEEWSKPIQGTGGSSFVAKEKSGLYTSDECFKMALTDAISVSCKALGVGADIYYSADRTKYSVAPETSRETIGQAKAETLSKLFTELAEKKLIKPTDRNSTMKKLGVTKLADLTEEQYGVVLNWLKKHESDSK